MSMTTSPFGAPVTEAPAAPVSRVDEPPPSSKRNVIILGVVAGALGLGAAAYFLVFAGGADPELATGPVLPRTPRAVASAPAVVPSAPPIKKYVAKKARNPFVPLVAVPVAAPAGTTSGTTSGTTTTGTTGTLTAGTLTTGTTSTGTTSGSTSGTTTGSTPAPSPTSTASSTTAPTSTKPLTSTKPIDVSVISVDFAKRSASIKINRNTYDRTIGETFATYFKLIGVSKNDCAYVQYGDVALPICVGQPLTLQ